MNKATGGLVLIVLSIFLWVFLYSYFKSGSKKVVQHFRLMAERYNFSIDLSNKIGKAIYPVISGIYRNRNVALGSNDGKSAGSKSPVTYIHVVCNNSRGISLLIIKNTKANRAQLADRIFKLADAEFDEKFLVTTNDPVRIMPVFTFNVKYSLEQAMHLGLRGKMILEGNTLYYSEESRMEDDNAHTKFELLFHIMCDIAYELEADNN